MLEITAKEAANKAARFDRYDIQTIDGYYDVVLNGPVVDPEGNRLYAVLAFEDGIENPDYDPGKLSSVSFIHYVIYALYELSDEEWQLYDEAHETFANTVGTHHCRLCHEQGGLKPKESRDSWYELDVHYVSELLEILKTREPASWTISGKYFENTDTESQKKECQ